MSSERKTTPPGGMHTIGHADDADWAEQITEKHQVIPPILTNRDTQPLPALISDTIKADGADIEIPLDTAAFDGFISTEDKADVQRYSHAIEEYARSDGKEGLLNTLQGRVELLHSMRDMNFPLFENTSPETKPNIPLNPDEQMLVDRYISPKQRAEFLETAAITGVDIAKTVMLRIAQERADKQKESETTTPTNSTTRREKLLAAKQRLQEAGENPIKPRSLATPTSPSPDIAPGGFDIDNITLDSMIEPVQPTSRTRRTTPILGVAAVPLNRVNHEVFAQAPNWGDTAGDTRIDSTLTPKPNTQDRDLDRKESGTGPELQAPKGVRDSALADTQKLPAVPPRKEITTPPSHTKPLWKQFGAWAAGVAVAASALFGVFGGKDKSEEQSEPEIVTQHLDTDRGVAESPESEVLPTSTEETITTHTGNEVDFSGEAAESYTQADTTPQTIEIEPAHAA